MYSGTQIALAPRIAKAQTLRGDLLRQPQSHQAQSGALASASAQQTGENESCDTYLLPHFTTQYAIGKQRDREPMRRSAKAGFSAAPLARLSQLHQCVIIF
jgi:hypothetical protein